LITPFTADIALEFILVFYFRTQVKQFFRDPFSKSTVIFHLIWPFRHIPVALSDFFVPAVEPSLLFP